MPSPHHRRMGFDLADGSIATVTGDPGMPPATMQALQRMMMCALEANSINPARFNSDDGTFDPEPHEILPYISEGDCP